MTAMNFKNIFEALLLPVKLALYPRKCICCGRAVNESSRLCPYCASHFERINPEKRCIRCGKEKRNCECGARTHYFESIIAPFYNSGLARYTLYTYKLSPKPHYAEYFAAEMAHSVKLEYSDIQFDAICYVPTSYRSKMKRGFDQAKELAEQLGRILNLPVLHGLLRRYPGGSGQHGLSLEQRDNAAKKRYYCSGRADAKKLLLVDDIATTCSTLDACTHRLLRAGAYEVHCITALISDGRRKGEKSEANGNKK